MRRHNDLAGRREYRDHCSLTERQFLTLALVSQKDRMTKCPTIYTQFESVVREPDGHASELSSDRIRVARSNAS